MAGRQFVHGSSIHTIEEEPLTLRINQLRSAREAARNVMNTMSVEDARRIFTEGLKPVVGARHRDTVKEIDLIDSEEEVGRTDLGGVRDIVSAPF
ncbi:hypothetical protein MLD38_035734 [Melastoma candidum]|uniref:Uncharacterized protein n=1 Tax=Melastoma candidum TaxID=119954 RepID=A0ACB9LI21_9MYRT|nr:hypothetical protein MLD38_035734 [Melastoma candidum]